MSQSQGPTLINLPPSGADTPSEAPSEAPGTPTSTTTSLSTLSTTAIKDGHRGHHLHGGPLGRSHGHNASTASLEAERADRISRLAGLERIAALRAPQHQQQQPPHGQSHGRQFSATHSTPSHSASNSSSINAPPSSSVPPHPPTTTVYPLDYPPNATLTPAYFNSQGQPVAAPTKMSTVGTASATESNGRGGDDDTDDARTTREDEDEDGMLSATDTASLGPMMTGDEDMEGGVGPRSVAGFEDRMSDDGSASLVGFGEGAGSTLSGPIYQRRPLSQLLAQYGGGNSSNNGGSGAGGGGGPGAPPTNWPPFERQGSGLSDVASASGPRRDRDAPGGGPGSDTPVSASALQERREARVLDGVAHDTVGGVPGDDMFVDTTTRSPVPSALLQQYQQYQRQQRQQQQGLQQQQQQQLDSQGQQQQQLGPQGQQQQPRLYAQQPRTPQQQLQPQPTDSSQASSSSPGDLETMVQSLERGGTGLPPGSAALGSPSSSWDHLGRFYFEEGRK